MPPRCLIIAAAPHGALYVALLDGFAFVVLCFAFSNTNFDLCVGTGEIDRKRHKGCAFFLYAGVEFLELISLQKQLARAHGRVVVDIALFVGADVNAEREEFGRSIFFALEHGIAVLEIAFTGAKRFDFRALQHDSCFYRVGDEVVVPCLAVLRHILDGAVFVIGWRGLFALMLVLRIFGHIDCISTECLLKNLRQGIIF